MTEDIKKGNYAFIDGQNLHSGVKKSGWKLDHKKFREFLREEFGVSRAYIFIGYMEEQQELYNVLQEAGFVLFFKPLLRYEDGTVKGNVDAELIVQTLIEKDKYDQAVIVSGDGDFVSMLRHLNGENKLKAIIIPNKFTYSSLFKRLEGFDKQLVTYIGDFKAQLAYGHSGRNYNNHNFNKKRPAKRPQQSKPVTPRKPTTYTSNPKPAAAAPKPVSTARPARPVRTTRPVQPANAGGLPQKNRVRSKAQVEEDMLATIAAQKPTEKPAPKPVKKVVKKPVKKPVKKTVKKSTDKAD